jgi:hypothetical protein
MREFVTSNTVQSIVTVSGVFVGLLVGLGAPWVTSAMKARADRGGEQHAVADRILSLWERPEQIPEMLRNDLYGIRRSLILLGGRLNDSAARMACLELVGMAADDNLPDSNLVDGWSDLVASVSTVFRRSAS